MLAPLFSLSFFLCLGLSLAQSIQLFLDDGALPEGVTESSPCGKALQSPIACSATLLTTSYTYFDAPTTQQICTAACMSSLVSYRKSISSSCAGVVLPGDEITYPATFVADQLIYNYNSTCLIDAKTGSLCSPLFQSLSNGTITKDTPMSAVPPAIACSSCMVQLAELSQQSAFGFQTGISQDLDAVQTMCGINFNLTMPGQVYLNVSIPANPSSLCLSGQKYNIKSGDTCVSISKAQSVGTGNLISINGLSSSCTEIQGGQSLCLPQKCTLYEVQSGDTCMAIINNLNSINFVQFYSWNPTINPYCTNLVAGSLICVSPPGGAFTATQPAVTVAPTGTQITTAVDAPAPTASGTNPNCGKWYVVGDGDTCNRVLLNQTITLADFISYNTEINSGCTNLILGFAYCVYGLSTPALPATFAPVPTNAAEGSLHDCYRWYTVAPGDTCTSILRTQHIPQSDFLDWNPELDELCTKLALGEAYCVSANPAIDGANKTQSSPAPASSTRVSASGNTKTVGTVGPTATASSTSK